MWRPMALAASVVLSMVPGVPVLASTIYPTSPGSERERQASCVMLLENAQYGTLPDSRSLPDLIRSTPIAGMAASEVLGIEPEKYHREIDVRVSAYHAQHGVVLSLSVGIDAGIEAPKGLAKSCLIAVLERFRDAVAELKESRVVELTNALEEARARLGVVQRKHDEVLARFDALRATPELKGISILEINSLKSHLRMNVMGYKNRLAQLHIGAQGGARESGEALEAASEAAVAAWQKVVDLRQNRLEQMRKRVAERPQEDLELAEFEARLAEARAAVLRQRTMPGSFRRAGFGGRSAGMRSISPETIQQLEDQLKGAEEQLERLAEIDTAELSRQMIELQDEARRLKEELAAVSKEVDERQRQADMARRVTLRIIGGESLREGSLHD